MAKRSRSSAKGGGAPEPGLMQRSATNVNYTNRASRKTSAARASDRQAAKRTDREDIRQKARQVPAFFCCQPLARWRAAREAVLACGFTWCKFVAPETARRTSRRSDHLVPR
jgi:hypothetical protein